ESCRAGTKAEGEVMFQDKRAVQGSVNRTAGASSWKRRILDVASSRWVGALAGGMILSIFLGCMSLSIGEKTYKSGCAEVTADNILVQTGETHLKSCGELDVFYPIPYAHTPNLE